MGAGWPAPAHASKLVWQSDCADGCSPAPLVLCRLHQLVAPSVLHLCLWVRWLSMQADAWLFGTPC